MPELGRAVFLNPQTQRWETDDAYLSGNIREKLEAAEAAAITDVRYKENVEALKSVLPEELKATEIDARLGSAWIYSEVTLVRSAFSSSVFMALRSHERFQ